MINRHLDQMFTYFMYGLAVIMFVCMALSFM